MITVARIVVYPFKSFDGLDVEQSAVTSAGGLEHDRRFALTSEDGRVINGKRTDRVHSLRLSYHPPSRRVTLARSDLEMEPAEFHVDGDREELELWLSTYFGLGVSIVENRDAGFPDDTDAPGPTFVSTQTLEEVASWFPGMMLDEARRRFRANVELDAAGEGPFWEDNLFGKAGEVRRFRVGEALFEGINPCARCVVPMRDSRTGKPNAEFQSTFRQRRARTLPASVERSRFDHFYRLAVNTRPAPASLGGWISRGDPVELLDTATA